MATYVTLANFTDQGVRNFKDTTKRARAFMDLVEEHGGKVTGIYWPLGAYDVVAIIEIPDDETATAIALQMSSLGNIRTTTMRGFNMTEIEAIIEWSKGLLDIGKIHDPAGFLIYFSSNINSHLE
jgi:uncharacterized protein with GYD domain